MMDFLQRLFSSEFMPHGYGYHWNPRLVLLHAVSDSLIAFSCFFIPLALIYFIRKKPELPFHRIVLSFGVFFLACGATQAMEVWTLYNGTYWLSGALKAVTATASVATAILLWQSVPHLLALFIPESLRHAQACGATPQRSKEST
jgi:two-component system, NtrC family, sensor kinase